MCITLIFEKQGDTEKDSCLSPGLDAKSAHLMKKSVFCASSKKICKSAKPSKLFV